MGIVTRFQSTMAVAAVCRPQEKGGKHKPMYSNGVRREWAKEGLTPNRWVLIRFQARMEVAAVLRPAEKGEENRNQCIVTG